MSAQVPVYCLVTKSYQEWIEVQAVTLSEAREKAEELPDVIDVGEVSYIPGGVVT